MTNQYLIIISLILAFVAANVPWVSDKVFLFFSVNNKSGWLRWIEWFVLYLMSLGMGFSLEYKLMGTLSSQDWEFYVVTMCLFIVFALPGFIYSVDLKKILKNNL